MDAENTSFDEFFGAMESDTGYQTEPADDAADAPAEETEPADSEVAPEGTEAGAGGESEGDAQGGGTAEPGAEPAAAPETFTLRVNEADQTVTREEMIAYAQKGTDYDRVKAALEQERNTTATLQARVNETEEVYGLIADLAKESGVEIGELLDQFRVARYKNQGLSDDAARERLGREKAERELAALKGKAGAQKTETDVRQERAQREVAEFNRRYPDVTLTKDVVDKLKPDVQSGMTLSEAYQKYMNVELAAENQRLQAQLAAEKQNKANAATSPGSMGDSGKQKPKTQFDDFFSAFDS